MRWGYKKRLEKVEKRIRNSKISEKNKKIIEGWNQKVSTSIIYDAEFREIKGNEEKCGPETEDAIQGMDIAKGGHEISNSDFEQYKKNTMLRKKKRSRKSDRSPG